MKKGGWAQATQGPSDIIIPPLPLHFPLSLFPLLLPLLLLLLPTLLPLLLLPRPLLPRLLHRRRLPLRPLALLLFLGIPRCYDVRLVTPPLALQF